MGVGEFGTPGDVSSAHREMTGERVLNRAQKLLERDRELAEIDGCIAAAAAGRASFLVLEGRAGMGKSSLLDEARARAAAAGLTTSSAIGSELEVEFAFGVVRQLLEPLVGALDRHERARVFEGAAALAEPVLDLRGEPAVGGQFAALHGLYWVAANLSGAGPLLLAVDDAHWSDAASLRWLAYLLNRLEGLPVLVAIATRPPQSAPRLEGLTTVLAHPGVRILSIGALGESSVAVLVKTALGVDPAPVFAAACLQATAGNPLGLNELLRDLRADGVVPTSAAAGDLETRAPDTIARRVQRDLSLLGNDVEQLACALAVIGDETDLRLVARLADLEVDDAAEAADDLQAVDLISARRPPRFAHPLLRAAVYDRLPTGARQKLHRRSAEILAFEGAQPEAVAAHLLRCEPGRSVDTVTWLRAAAPAALRRGAPEAAVAYLRRAVAEEMDANLRAAILAELGSAEQVARDPAADGHLRRALAATGDRRARGAILCNLALVQEHERAQDDLYHQAMEELRDTDPDASTRIDLLLTGSSAGYPELATSVEGHYPRLRDLAKSGGPNAEFARVTLAMLLSHRDGNREEALSWIGSGFDWKAHYDAPGPVPAFGCYWVALTLLGIDDLHGAARVCENVLRAAATDGYVVMVAASLIHKAHAEFRIGLLADAEADATAAFEMSKQQLPWFVPGIGAHLAQILFERGRHQEAYQVIEGVKLRPDGTTDGAEPGIREIRGRLRCARGWRQRGLEDLRASGMVSELLLMRNPIISPWRASLATALTHDCPEEARLLAEENLTNARRSGIPRGVGVALRTLARLDRDEAVHLLRAAVAALEESPGQLDLARALTDLGAALRRRGHRVDAREPLREALEIAARCGAVALMERVREEAIAAGARPRRPRLRGVDALTPSELRVARLAAEGRSNPEIAQVLFITARTVADHLSSSYGKLAIRSREQLATALTLSTP